MTAPAPADIAAVFADGSAAGHWVVDPGGSRADFHVKHFWGLITVHGSLGQLAGEADVSPAGTIAAQLMIDAVSLSTKNKNPHVAVTVTSATPAGPASLAWSPLGMAAKTALATVVARFVRSQ